MAGSQVADIFHAAQQSVASHRRNVLKLRSLQSKAREVSAFHDIVSGMVVRVLPTVGNAVAVTRVIDFVTLLCSQVDGSHNDDVGVHIIEVGCLCHCAAVSCGNACWPNCADNRAFVRGTGQGRSPACMHNHW